MKPLISRDAEVGWGVECPHKLIQLLDPLYLACWATLLAVLGLGVTLSVISSADYIIHLWGLNSNFFHSCSCKMAVSTMQRRVIQAMCAVLCTKPTTMCWHLWSRLVILSSRCCCSYCAHNYCAYFSLPQYPQRWKMPALIESIIFYVETPSLQTVSNAAVGYFAYEGSLSVLTLNILSWL